MGADRSARGRAGTTPTLATNLPAYGQTFPSDSIGIHPETRSPHRTAGGFGHVSAMSLHLSGLETAHLAFQSVTSPSLANVKTQRGMASQDARCGPQARRAVYPGLAPAWLCAAP